MSGLFALLDDVAAIAKLAAASIDDVGAAAGKASTKALGVVVDDTAVTPRYAQGFHPSRELPIVKGIAIGSIRNKLLIILPVAMLLSQFLPSAMNWMLIAGGTFLAFEGAEKVLQALGIGHHEGGEDEPTLAVGSPEHEKAMVAGAIRTDLILSAEIMAISLAEVADQPFAMRLAIMIVVAIVLTVAVYGVVALIIKMDDVGLRLAQTRFGWVQSLGRGLVKGMPVVMQVLSVVGTAAMLWVGGHIVIGQADGLGMHWPASILHHWEEAAAQVLPMAGGLLSWVVETASSAVFGLLLGLVVLGVVTMVRRVRSPQSAH